MLPLISARVKLLQAKRREIRAKIHRTLILALIAPLFVTISAPPSLGLPNVPSSSTSSPTSPSQEVPSPFTNTANLKSSASITQGANLNATGVVARFDAKTYASYSGTGTSWSDISGNGFSAAFTNKTSPLTSDYTAGEVTFKGIAFNGTNQFATINSNLSGAFSGLSISFYANLGAATNYERIVDIGDGAGNKNILIARNSTTQSLVLAIYNGVTSEGFCQANSGIDNNTWAHWAFVVDGTNCRIYKNGTAFNSITNTKTNVTSTSGSVAYTGLPENTTRSNAYIGKSNWATDLLFEGAIADLAIFNRALTPADVTEWRIDQMSSTVHSGAGVCPNRVANPASVTVTRDGGACVVTFTAPSNTTTSNTWIVPGNASSTSILVVAGGGSGGARHAAGGGAGGYVYRTGVSVTPAGTVAISVGKGGDAVGTGNSDGKAGVASSFGATSAAGGGFGGQTSAVGNGGSGGGGCCSNAAGSGNTPPLSPSQGNNGGVGTRGNSENNFSGGGGGGAGSAGGNSTSTSTIDGANGTTGTVTGGAGGSGVINSITGGDVCYAAGGGGGVAASGAGAGHQGKCGATTAGGWGGKGSNGAWPNYLPGQGVDGTGSGGGGGGFEGGNNQTSGRGGSGIVVVRYDLPVVTISANSGTGSPSATTLNVNSSNQVTLPTKNTLARDGYTFGGWNTATDGTGTNYAESVMFTPTGNITLHARWFPIATFNGNSQATENSTVPAPISVTSASANNALPIPYSLRKGLYRFGGWNANSAGTGTNTNGSNVDIYDVVEPYLRLEAANYDISTNVWVATNGANVPASKVKSAVNISKVTNVPTSGFGGTETFTALRGTRASGIALGNAELSNGFTFCSVARPTTVQTIGATNGGRIFDGVTGNWLAGWWGGYQGSFYHEGWMRESSIARDTNFHVICDRPAISRFDGAPFTPPGSVSTALPEMTINNGNYTAGNTRTPAGTLETSDWEVAEVILYDRTLGDADVLKVESYLKYRYGVTAATNVSYTLGSATASYGTATPQTVFARWNSVITFDTNSGTTGTAPANQTITGTGAALSGNTESLVKGVLAFLGWYTNKTGSGGTFYAAGATYPNTGSKTLYAVYGPALSLSGGNTATFASGTGGKSETYTVSGGVGTRIVANLVSPANAGITLDSSTANSLVIKVASTVAPGTYIDTITVRDDGFTSTKVITITVASPLIWSASNPTSVVTTFGKPSRTRLDLSGGSGTRIATLVHVSSPAPRFVTLDSSAISSNYVTLITDTATAPGTYVESITVTDSTNVRKTLLFTITINSPPDIGYTSATDAEYPLLTSNLFLNYDFTNPNSYAGTGTTINSLSGNAISSSVTSADMFSNSGGGSFSLTGTNASPTPTRVAVIQHQPFINSQSFSKFLWIYPTSGTGSLINVCDNTSCNSYHKSEFEMLNGVLYAAAYATGTLNSGSNTVPLNQWSYVGFTWEYVNASLSYTKLYINGKLVGSRTNSGSRAAPSVEYNVISDGDSTSLATTANGTFLFGAYHVYKAAITPTQIFANYSNTKTRFLGISPVAPTVSGNETLTVTEGKSRTFQVFTETGGTSTNTFSLSGVNSAISLASVGTDQTSVVVGSNITAISASQARSYSETLTATDSSTAATAYFFTVVVNPKILITTTSDTITTTFGRTGSTTLNVAANTGTGSSTFSRVSGSGSSAISAAFTTGQAILSVAGTLPAGTYYETLTATDSLGATTSKVIVIVVNPTLTLTSASGVNQIETTFTRSTSLTINVANGTGTRTAAALPVIVSGITISTTNLQTGTLVINLSNAVAVGTYVETITVTDSVSASTSLVIRIIVNSAPTISFGGSSSGTVSFTTTQGGNLRSNAFTAANGTGNRALVISGTNTGISIDTSTANTAVLTFGPSLLSNSASQARTYSETLTVTDSLGVTSIRLLTIQVNPPIILAVNSTSIATTSGIETSTVVTASRGSSVVTFTRTGTSTSGITLSAVGNQATLRVLSTINPGTYFETVTATDTASATTSMMFTIVVSPPPSLLGVSRIETSKGVLFTTPVYAISGGTGTLTMSVTNSPANANISLTGVTSLGGFLQVAAASETGTYTSTIRVTDARGAFSEIAVTVIVNAPVTLSGALSITKTYGNSTTNGYSTNGTGTAPFSFSATPVCAVVRTVSGSFTYERINGTDSCTWTAPVGVTAVDALLVGAGGGGGGDGGPGGGGGSINTLSAVALPANRQLTVQIGAGGTGGVYGGSGATSGGTTSVTSGPTAYTAPGGSGGGGCGAAGASGGALGSNGSATVGGAGGSGSSGACTAGNGAAGSAGPSNSFTGSAVNYGGGGGGGPYPSTATTIGGQGGGTGGGGTGASSSAYVAGLNIYVRDKDPAGNRFTQSIPNATSTQTFTSGTCATLSGEINFDWGVGAPSGCDSQYFQGYAVGYFKAPISGYITFYTSSDDSSYVYIGGSIDQNLDLSDCCREAVTSPPMGPFTAGQYYPIQAYFTEIGGSAYWKVSYSWAGQSGYANLDKIIIPNSSLFRNLASYVDATPGTNGLGGGGGGGSAGTFKTAGGRGGSGTAIIKYLTQSETATAAMITAVVETSTPTGLVTLNVPANVTVGTYTQVIKVQGAANSAPYSATVTITVNKATPTATLSLPGSVTTATYGTPVTLSVRASTPGNIAFKKSGTALTGCSSVATSSGVATCTWTPTAVETASVSVLLSPTDSTNYNNSVETASALSIVVGKADTLTVTAGNITTTYSEDGSGNPNTTVASPTFTLTGLASIDSITAMSYAYTGTQNNGSNYASNPTAPKVAGTYSITPGTAVFTSPGTVNNYRNVTFAPGTLTINRKGRGAWTATYGVGTNTITYGASKQETPTVTYPGDGTRSFTTTSSVCSVNSSTGVITTLGVGSCAVTAVLSQTANWLSDTLTATVTINRGPRVATVTPASSTIRYGETTTVNSTVTQALDSATVTFSAGSFLGCAVDNVTGEVTGIRAGASCAVSVTYGQTDLYESATASAAMTINKALAPVVTTETITAVSYTGNTALVTPTYRVSGVLARDILQLVPIADISDISLIDPTTYSTVASYKYFATNPTLYDSTTAPSFGGTYAVTPQTFTLLSGVDISNYETPTYVSSNLVINPIVQAALRILLSAQESVTVPYDITFAGGSSTGSISAVIISGGSATGCSVSALRLSTSTAGTCILQATKLGDRNYLDVISDTATVTILNFVAYTDFNALFDSGSGITITSAVPTTVGPDTCSVDCVPEITDVRNAIGNPTTTLTVGVPLRLIGVDLNTSDRVLFTARINGVRLSNVPAVSFQIDSPTQITVMPPANFVPNTGENSSSISVRIIVFSSGGSINTEKIVIISL